MSVNYLNIEYLEVIKYLIKLKYKLISRQNIEPFENRKAKNGKVFSLEKVYHNFYKVFDNMIDKFDLNTLSLNYFTFIFLLNFSSKILIGL